MKRFVFTTLLFLLFVSLAIASDPPSQTIGSYYSMNLSGTQGTAGSQQFLSAGDGDDESHPCTGRVSGVCTYDPSSYTSRVKGYVHEGILSAVAPTYCVSTASTNQTFNLTQGGVASEDVTFDSDLPYSMRIEIEVGSWNASYQFNIQEPANGNGDD